MAAKLLSRRRTAHKGTYKEWSHKPSWNGEAQMSIDFTSNSHLRASLRFWSSSIEQDIDK